MTGIAATIIGAGSVGLGLAASLAVAGQRVTLLARAGSVAALRDSPITVGGQTVADIGASLPAARSHRRTHRSPARRLRGHRRLGTV